MSPNVVSMISQKVRKRICGLTAKLLPNNFTSMGDFLFEEFNSGSIGIHTDGIMIGLCEMSERNRTIPKRLCLINGAENISVKRMMESWQRYWLKQYFFSDISVQKTIRLGQGEGFAYAINTKSETIDVKNMELNEEFKKKTDFRDLVSFKLFISDRFQISLAGYRSYDSKDFSVRDWWKMQQYLSAVGEAISCFVQKDPLGKTFGRIISNQLAVEKRTQFLIV